MITSRSIKNLNASLPPWKLSIVELYVIASSLLLRSVQEPLSVSSIKKIYLENEFYIALNVLKYILLLMKTFCCAKFFNIP